MLQVQVRAANAPRVLAELIRSTQNEADASPEIEAEARLVREHQSQGRASQPPWQTLDTVDFHKLDAENDWTDV
jgi:hypothetical protein